MTDDPASWLRELTTNLRADPGLPPGVIILESGDERVARLIRSGRHIVGTEAQMEDSRSFYESFPYLIRVSERGEPIRRECCGTPVMQVPEAKTGGRGWKPGIWEQETYRRHTMRRCEWKQANP